MTPGPRSRPTSSTERHIGEIDLRDWRALLIEFSTVGPDFVEPDAIGAADTGLGKQQDRGLSRRKRLVGSGRYFDYGIEGVVLDEGLAQG